VVVNGALYLNQGGLVFVSVPSRIPSSMAGESTLLDVDGDGDLDLIAFVSGTTPGPRLALNDGTGLFTDVTATHLPAPAAYAGGVAAADLDGDGDLDLVFVGRAGAVLMLNQGGGRFVDASARLNIARPLHSVAAGDIDGNHTVDLVFGGTWLTYAFN